MTYLADYRIHSGDRGAGTVCRDVPEKKHAILYQALGVYLPLITTNCAVLGVALTNVQKDYNVLQGGGKWICNSSRIYYFDRADGWYS